MPVPNAPPPPSDVTKREDALDRMVVTTGAETSMSRQRRKALHPGEEGDTAQSFIIARLPPVPPCWWVLVVTSGQRPACAVKQAKQRNISQCR